MTALIKQLNLSEITLFVQDWGGMIGLRVVAQEPDRFARIIAGNTGLPDATGVLSWVGPLVFNLLVLLQRKIRLEDLRQKLTLRRWVAYSRTAKDFPVSELVQIATKSRLSPDVMAAYDAPFPDDRYKAGAWIMPSLILSQLIENHQAWKQVLSKWKKPFLTAFSDGDPITRGQDKVFQARVPGAQGQPHLTVKSAGHFLQEDKGEELADVILDFIERSRSQ